MSRDERVGLIVLATLVAALVLWAFITREPESAPPPPLQSSVVVENAQEGIPADTAVHPRRRKKGKEKTNARSRTRQAEQRNPRRQVVSRDGSSPRE